MDIKNVLEKIKDYDVWPPPFEQGESIWDDEYISSHMLRAHLDDSHDKASYKSSLRQKVAQNIINKYSLKEGDSVLDLGCGPGLYAKEFAIHGIKYTGIDISKQSLGYAMVHKDEYNSLISYIQADYTQHIFKESYDCAMMIWCDFGALSPAKRDTMLANVNNALKPGGGFCFDVYAVSSQFKEHSNKWRVEDSGFWQSGLYVILERSKYYKAVGAGLYSAMVVSERGVRSFRIWDKRYSKDELLKVLRYAGFYVTYLKKGGLSKKQKDMYGVFLKT